MDKLRTTKVLLPKFSLEQTRLIHIGTHKQQGADLLPFDMPAAQRGPAGAWGDMISHSEYHLYNRVSPGTSTASFFWNDHWGTNTLVISVEGMTDGDILGFGSGPFTTIRYKFQADGIYEVAPDTINTPYGLKMWNTLTEGVKSTVTVKFWRHKQ